jgi:peroxiredoxin
MRLIVGNKAPDFSLYSSDKKEINLVDFEGNSLLILFFPLAFTSVCTAELCGIRDNYQDYKNLSTTVIGISVDSLFVLEKFKEEQKINFQLLSDFNREISRSYGCLYDNFVLGMKQVSKRAAFIVDKMGIIQYAEVLEDATSIPNFDAIKQVLEEIK